MLVATFVALAGLASKHEHHPDSRWPVFVDGGTLPRCTDEYAGSGPCDGGLTNNLMNLTTVSVDTAHREGALCLDGSPPGYYLQMGPAGTTQWLIYLKGGAWCKSEEECAARAKSSLGSTDSAPKTLAFSGLMDSDPSVNPDFAHYNRVILWYCDGASFAGDRDDPVVHAPTNQTLWFRGLSVLRTTLNQLCALHGLADATDVILSGGSAGGLAALLHADKVREWLKTAGAPLKRYRAVPNSGFFLMHDTADGEPVWPEAYKATFELHQANNGVNGACVAALKGDHWKCFLANYSYAYSSTPMFLLNSALDKWQMGHIWAGDTACVGSDFANCTAAEVADLNGYASDFLTDLRRPAKQQQPGEGGFITSCLEHVAAQGGGFGQFSIDGVLERDALSKWWHADEQAEPMWWLPCSLSATAPHPCNPTCGDGAHYRAP